MHGRWLPNVHPHGSFRWPPLPTTPVHAAPPVSTSLPPPLVTPPAKRHPRPPPPNMMPGALTFKRFTCFSHGHVMILVYLDDKPSGRLNFPTHNTNKTNMQLRSSMTPMLRYLAIPPPKRQGIETRSWSPLRSRVKGKASKVTQLSLLGEDRCAFDKAGSLKK